MIDDASTPNNGETPTLTINYSKKHKIYFDDNLRVTTKHSPSNVKFLESKPESMEEMK